MKIVEIIFRCDEKRSRGSARVINSVREVRGGYRREAQRDRQSTRMIKIKTEWKGKSKQEEKATEQLIHNNYKKVEKV